jgi:ribonucleoside-diphosphate reductase alpha chain
MSEIVLPTSFQQFIHLSRYARWNEEKGRRETWQETVDRYINHMCDKQCPGKIPPEVREEIRSGILNLEVMPSMRCLMTAGEALEKTAIAAYNCCFIAIDDPKAFDEILLILMCGTGVGISVERQFICHLPVIAEKFRRSNTVISVEDSREGWANAFRELISMLYAGSIPNWDTSKVRPAGARLKTFGGRASGPGPLTELFQFTVDTFKEAAGRKLNSVECHDICCKIGEIVICGGVRRSAIISLSNPSDDRMRYAKSGEWWKANPHRALANVSACYTEKPGMDVFMREWLALYDSKSGERGIFNREAAKKNCAKYGRRDATYDYGTNPCCEVIAKSCQFCNLTEVVTRPGDTEETLKRKVRLATIMGTMQATITNFSYLRKIWRQNTEEEALLGVSITGILDNKLLSGADGKKKLAETLGRLREYVVSVNKEWAAKLGINQATATTVVKPSGTVSALVNCSSGIHPRHSQYFIRTIRADKKDPLAKMMVEMGFPHEDDVTKPEYNWVFSFPMQSPEGSVLRDDLTAIDHLELWKTYQDHWTEHKPSVTVNIRESEWMDVGAWVYRHFDSISGVAFLPFSGHSYRQAPYREATKEEYDKAMAAMPKNVDWSKLGQFELEDNTQMEKALACNGSDTCDLIDLNAK